MHERLFSYTLWVVTQVIITRTLGTASVGLFSLTVVIVYLIACLAGGSLIFSNSIHIHRFPDERFALVGNSLFFAVVWGTLLAGVIYFLIFMIPEGLFLDYNTVFWSIAVTAILPLMLFNFSSGILAGRNRVLFCKLTELIYISGLLFFISWFSWLGTISNKMVNAVWILVLSASAILLFLIAWGNIGYRIAFDIKLLLKSIVFEPKRYFVKNFDLLIPFLSLMFAAHYLRMSEVGQYVIVFLIAGFVWRLPSMFIKAPVSLESRQDIKSEISPQSQRIAFTISTAAVIFLGLTGWIFIRFLFNIDTFPCYSALLILLPGGIFITQSRMILEYNMNRTVYFSIISIMLSGFIIGIGLNISLIPIWGIIGASLAFSLSQLFIGILLLYIHCRESGENWQNLFLIHSGDIQISFFSFGGK